MNLRDARLVARGGGLAAPWCLRSGRSGTLVRMSGHAAVTTVRPGGARTKGRAPARRQGTAGWRAVIATAVLGGVALSGCRDAGGDAAAEQTGSSSSAVTIAGDVSIDSSSGEARACTPGETRPCYEGPLGTEGVGACRAGEQICEPGGQAWSACEGERGPQPERCDTPEDDDCDGSPRCEPAVEWWHSFSASVAALTADSAGNVIMAGATGSAQIDGVWVEDLFLAKFDPEGSLAWANSVSEAETQFFTDIAADPRGQITAVGQFEGTPDFGGGPLPWEGISRDTFVVRYDAQGEHLWSRSFVMEANPRVVVGPDGYSYFASGGQTALEPKHPDQIAYVVALDPQGEITWAKGVGFSDFATNTQPDLVMVEGGELVLVLLLGWGNSYEFDGTVIVPEKTQLVALRLNAQGELVDHQLLGEEGVDVVNDQGWFRLLEGPDGGLTVAANLYEIVDGAFVNNTQLVRLNAALEVIDRQRLAGTALLRDVARHPDGSTLLAAEFSGVLDLGTITVATLDFQSAMLLAALDMAGGARWAETFGTNDPSAWIFAIAVDPQGAVFVAGTGTQVSLGGERVGSPFLLKLAP